MFIFEVQLRKLKSLDNFGREILCINLTENDIISNRFFDKVIRLKVMDFWKTAILKFSLLILSCKSTLHLKFWNFGIYKNIISNSNSITYHFIWIYSKIYFQCQQFLFSSFSSILFSKFQKQCFPILAISGCNPNYSSWNKWSITG